MNARVDFHTVLQAFTAYILLVGKNADDRHIFTVKVHSPTKDRMHAVLSKSYSSSWDDTPG